MKIKSFDKRLIPIMIVIVLGVVFIAAMNRSEASIYYGEIESESFDVYSKVPGLIDSVLVSAGDQISEGQIVVQLDSSEAVLRNQKAEIASRIAEENIVKSVSPLSSEKTNIQTNTISQLQSQKEGILESIEGAQKSYKQSVLTSDAMKASYELQKTNLDNIQLLYEAGIESKSSLDNAELALTNSKTAYDNALIQSSKILNEINSLNDQSDAMDQQIASAEEQLLEMSGGYEESDQKIVELTSEIASIDSELAQIVLDDYDIKAFNEGVVESVNYDRGEYVNPGTPVVSMYDPNRLVVKIFVFEKDMLKLTVGMDMVFHLTIDETIVLKGKVKSIASQAMFTPVNVVIAKDRERLVYEVEVILEAHSKVKAGMLLSTDFMELE